jgi:hypothetical protein
MEGETSECESIK